MSFKNSLYRDLAILIIFCVTSNTLIAFFLADRIGKLAIFFNEIFIVAIPALIVYLKHKEAMEVTKKEFKCLRCYRLGVKKLNLPALLPLHSGLIIIFLYIPLLQIEIWTNRIYPMPEEMIQALEKLLKVTSLSELLWLALMVIILPPLCEEILFRLTLQTPLIKQFGLVKGIIIVNIIFTLMHLNPWWALPIFLLGILISYLYYLTGRFSIAIGAHFLINLSGGFLEKSNALKLPIFTPAGNIFPLIWIISLLLGLWLLALLQKQFKCQPLSKFTK